MSYPRYPEYQTSEVRWLGNVPSHWDIFSLKRAVDGCINGVWGDEPDGNNDSIVVRVADFDRETLRVGIEKLTLRSVPERDKQNRLVRPGDLLIEKSGGGDKTLVGCVVLFDLGFNAVTSNFVGRMRPLLGFDANFLCYAFSSLYQQRVNYPAIKQTTGIQNLDVEAYLQERFCFPPITEQTQIARFLDHQTARIDALIAEQQRLIELLKEKRQAVISHAVTKGLDPGVAMKDSGVEWLGEVPEHWTITRLKHYADLITGYPFPSSGFSEDEGDIKLLRGANVGIQTLKWDDTVYWHLLDGDPLDQFLMRKDQIVIGMDRPWIGDGLRIARVKEIDLPCLLVQRVAAIDRTADELNVDFLYQLLSGDLLKAYIEPELTGVSVPHISPDQIMGFEIPLPPLEEQAAIASYVSEEFQKLDSLLAQADSSSALLQERRSALISAAVTGKIDVRDWEPPVSETFPQSTVNEEAPA